MSAHQTFRRLTPCAAPVVLQTAHSTLRARPAGYDTEPASGCPIFMCFRNTKICRQGKFQSTAQAMPVDGGDDGWRMRASASKARCPCRTHFIAKSSADQPDHASMSPPAQKDFSPAPVMMTERLSRIVGQDGCTLQRQYHIVVERVQLLWPFKDGADVTIN